MKKYLYLLVLLNVFSCAKKSVPIGEKNQEISSDYSEDLTEFRELLAPKDSKPEPEITNNNQTVALTNEPLYVNKKIEAILEKKSEKNKSIKYANGYRIQLYVGRERKIVDDAKVYIYQTYPNINPYLTYNLPVYRLRVGDFLTKGDAERFLNQLKDSYPDAIIISEKIDVKRSFLK